MSPDEAAAQYDAQYQQMQAERYQEWQRSHTYVSTACLHDLHDRCRLTCKFCEKPCVCTCHLLANKKSDVDGT